MASAVSSKVYCTKQFDVLDALCHEWYGGTQGTVEAVMEANPDLAELLPILPPGVMIFMPTLPKPHETTTLARIWSGQR